ncbi:hypothetical protein KK137_13495 [Croceibacterium sp. LX-88]|jgi:hypothetical protein|uniref:DUF2059 domain-containing protein n=1 Tax=Croceibacterium selenioxidans TaxID=2838833 RepID=A0ABS5W6H7_9SPHN|nr:hypothetical protein [Croceibacterium selenioxidans]MBT2135347.1 hypothetical protein [Croceibacterium selenioxidans]
MRDLFYGLSLAAAGLAASVVAPTAMAQDAAAAHYSVTETKVGKLLDDPAAAEILKRLIPKTFANEMFQTLGRDLTLKGVQQYEAELSDDNLAKIQAEFDKIPAK